MMDDRTLVNKVLAGDLQAFRTLIRQHERLVSHMVGRLVKTSEEREELVQDVFLKVHDKLGEFAFQSRLSTWIATIAYRLSINHLRKGRMRYTEVPEEEMITGPFIEAQNPESVFEEDDMDAFVMKLIDLLPPQYKAVLTLFHVENMSYSEICQVMQMPEGTVKNYLFRARTLLKEHVKKHASKEELL